ncbi:HYR domain-containing protein, partial [Myxococcota bacterium]|nr:HYR domain-containing protein [Myxococcota bacterium]
GAGDVCDADDDNDGVDDASDNCSMEANADQANNDADGAGDVCDADDDNDGVDDGADNCAMDANADQADNDADGAGDACDADDDNDGVDDAIDNCDFAVNASQVDTDADAEGDVCDADDDNDGLDDGVDNCSLVANADQADFERDGIGDACDADDDNDNVDDAFDNCLWLANANQADRDGDAIGDVCDDSDDDSWLDSVDNCWSDANPDQYDRDSDGRGDVCDNCIVRANADQADDDGDGMGNVCDAQPAVPGIPTETSTSLDPDATVPQTVTSPSGIASVSFPPGAFPAGSEPPTFSMILNSYPSQFRVVMGASSGAGGGAVGGTILAGWDMQVSSASTYWLEPGTSATVTIAIAWSPSVQTAYQNNTLAMSSHEPGGLYLLIPNCASGQTTADGRCSTVTPYFDPVQNRVTRYYVSMPAIHFSEYLVVDVTPPSIFAPPSIVAEATGANGATIEYSVTAEDNTDGFLAVTCSPASGSVFAIGSTVVGCSATDLDGNTTSASFSVVVRDTTAPVITVPANIAVIATTAAGTTVSYTTSASDIVSGDVATTCAPASGSVFAPGTTTVSCTASDAAGNASTSTFDVTVTFDWSNVLSPVNANGSSVFKQGSTVPVKFQLTGASAGVTDVTARLYVAQVSNGVVGDVTEAVSTASADSGSQFRYSDGKYIFNLSTKSLSEGQWVLRVDLGDGVIRDVRIGLRR